KARSGKRRKRQNLTRMGFFFRRRPGCQDQPGGELITDRGSIKQRLMTGISSRRNRFKRQKIEEAVRNDDPFVFVGDKGLDGADQDAAQQVTQVPAPEFPPAFYRL